MSSLQEKILKFKRQLVNIFKFVIIVFFASITVIYAKNITNISQTAVLGDKITSDWVNDVNKKLTGPKPNSEIMYMYVTGSNVGNSSKNINLRNKLIADSVTQCSNLGNGITKWKELCTVSSTGTIIGIGENGVGQSEMYNRCSTWMCACALKLQNSMSQMWHCGTYRGEGTGCNVGGFNLKCMYSESTH